MRTSVMIGVCAALWLGSSAHAGLAGTSWRLVAFHGRDGTNLTPTAGNSYSVEFRPDGKVLARIDCNRANGTWKLSDVGGLRLGPLAITRMACPPSSLADKIVSSWTAVRSYMVDGGYLLLWLDAGAGIFEFEPVGPAAVAMATQLETPEWSPGLRAPAFIPGPVFSNPVRITGMVSFPDGAKLPNGAVLEVVLEEPAMIDSAAGPFVAQTRVEDIGRPPIPYALGYDAVRVDPDHRYLVRARLILDDRVIYVSSRDEPVLTGGNGRTVAIRLHRVIEPVHSVVDR